MKERLIRLMRMINLIQSKPGILARELADRCETTERTIYREILALHAMNIPISNHGHGKGYAFISNFSMYPLDWTEQEALSFSMLPSVLEQMKSLLPEGFDSALEKVMGVHKKEKSKRADILQHVTDVIQMGTPAYREEDGSASFLYDIIQARLSQQTIRTVYYTQSRNEESQRDIDPYYLVPRDHRFYLIGYCHSAGDIRTFRISRFRDVKQLSDTFDKGDFNLKSYMKNTWSIERGADHIRFKVKFHPNIARYVKEEELFVKPKLTPQKDGSLLFEVTVNHEREFMNWLSQYGPEAEIMEPKVYRDIMKLKLDQWRTLYE
ncbi:helix-turn-helix transcriptional regulator [Paenibacillus sp. Soil724D2]|uniref:helix-turn-helix transcriptional regulator n=1 Tax=Paenibacillus sp. (strain Soil724D2) TaxID=1736392 RepID=UPI000712FACA|nr:transcriptional regulator [Paenibacillus sp. Soil724D2]KRE50669.1 transcriptional regulator [Paenibacillus sp. Soil724D2]